MTAKFVILLCLQALTLQSALGQLYQQLLSNQVIEAVPSCGCSYPQVVSLPQQVVQVPQQVVQVPQQVVQVPQQVVPTTVVQDSSVSNNLANALQLLVVSNLLSNTLPFNEAEVVVPYCGGAVVEQVASPYVGGYYSPQVVSSCGCGGYAVPSCGCGGYSVPSCGCGGYTVPSCGCGGVSGLNGLGGLLSVY